MNKSPPCKSSRMPSVRPVSSIAFSVGNSAVALPHSETAAIRAILDSHTLNPHRLSFLLQRLRILDAGFRDALFTLSNFEAVDDIPINSFLTVYAVLRRLAYASPDSARSAAQDAVWLAFCASAGGTNVESVSWDDWYAFQAKMGEELGGLESFPHHESVKMIRKAWRKERSPFHDNLSFHKLLNVLRTFDAGFIKCLRAMGFLLACRVIDLAGGSAEKPVWREDDHDLCFGQFLSHAIDQDASRTLTVAPPSGANSGYAAVEKHLANGLSIKEQPKRVSAELQKQTGLQKSASSRRVRFGFHKAEKVAKPRNNESPTTVFPNNTELGDGCRNLGKNGSKTPFHIKYADLQLGEKIGSGAYGDVFKGSYLMCPVAVKLFHVNRQREMDDTDPTQMSRQTGIDALQRFASVNSQMKYTNFVREVEMMSVVRHPNLVLYMGACGDPRTPLCIVSELFTGGSLFEFLHGSTEFRPSLKMALSFSLNIARGMFYLHSSHPSILHRDLKSRNVLLSGRKNHDDGIPHVVICDFGLSQLFGEDAQSANQMGTASYMSPDVINGEKYEAADDVFSYGVLLYEIFTGRVPYNGMRAIQVMFKVATEQMRPSFEGAKLPRKVVKFIEKCWHKDKSKRPGFDEIIEKLHELEAALVSIEEPR